MPFRVLSIRERWRFVSQWGSPFDQPLQQPLVDDSSETDRSINLDHRNRLAVPFVQFSRVIHVDFLNFGEPLGKPMQCIFGNVAQVALLSRVDNDPFKSPPRQ